MLTYRDRGSEVMIKHQLVKWMTQEWLLVAITRHLYLMLKVLLQQRSLRRQGRSLKRLSCHLSIYQGVCRSQMTLRPSLDSSRSSTITKLRRVRMMTTVMTMRLTSSVVGVTAAKKAADGPALEPQLPMVPSMT